MATFRFENVAPGGYHVSVRTTGYSSRPTEVTVAAAGGAPVDVLVDPDLHFQEVASVSAEVRSQFDAFQPTTVLAGQELTKQLESSLGATLENQPGISVRSFGPAPSRPVIRGLDGDRVLILAGWPANRRSLEPVGRSRRQPQSCLGGDASRSSAAPPRCCTVRMRLAGS